MRTPQAFCFLDMLNLQFLLFLFRYYIFVLRPVHTVQAFLFISCKCAFQNIVVLVCKTIRLFVDFINKNAGVRAPNVGIG